jgi:NAD(P)-dependent dehydrogenase (short-subunit alcohol dehydrogenase family)
MAAEKTIVLITGANSGIGFDSSALIAASSPKYHVILCSRSTEKGEKALAELRAREETQGTLSLVRLDVTNEDSIAAAVKEVSSSFGRLDILVNNAGMVSFTPALTAQLRETLETNTIGAAAVTDAFLPLLKQSPDPRLIYVSSGLGSIALRLDASYPYSALPATTYRVSKAALNMLAACHAMEFKEWGCKVWAFDPGFVITNLTGEADRGRRRKQGAESSEVSARALLRIVVGERDGEVGRHVHKDGVHPW